MRWIGTNGIASFKQIQTVFWPGATARTCRERLALLEKSGLIERHYVQTSRKRGEQVYTLTDHGATEYFEAAMRKRLMVGLPTHTKVKQQLIAQETWIALEKMLAPYGKRIVNWQNEKELRSEAAFLKRKPGSRTFGGLADVADARVFIGMGSTVTPGQDETGATGEGQPASGPASLPRNFGSNDSGSKVAKPVSNSLHPASFLVLDTPDYTDGIQRIDIEIDGQYYGQMLDNKIAKIAGGKLPTLWVTTSQRAERIKSEIVRTGPSNIGVLIVDPLL